MEKLTPHYRPQHHHKLVMIMALVLPLLLVACAATQNVLTVSHASMPDWDLDEMVERSDAVVVGTISRELASKGVPSGPPDDLDSLVLIFTDYELEVQRYLYPPLASPRTIAIMGVGGETEHKGTLVSFGLDQEPQFEVGERVLLFLWHLPADAYDIEGYSIPVGFTRDSYYDVLASRDYGKFVLAADNIGKDDQSGKSLAISDVEAVIERVKGLP